MMNMFQLFNFGMRLNSHSPKATLLRHHHEGWFERCQ
jgi:hypothetical protein